MTKEAMLAESNLLLCRALGHARRVCVKGVPVETEEDIPAAVKRCWHDPLSDLDVEVWGCDPAVLTRGMPLLGVCCRDNVYRMVTCSGFRADIICHDAPDPTGNGTEEFWFIAVQAVGKLLRGDHLIAAHLAHMLLMQTLEEQMLLRDRRMGTNVHRYGGREELDYLTWDVASAGDVIPRGGTQAHIADMLVRAALCHDPAQAQTFLTIWRQYLKEMSA